MSNGYDAAIYDATIPASFFGDLDWYRQKARECGGLVLELGAGTGRVVLKLAQDGIRVHALDSDPEMLTALRRKIAAEADDVRALLHNLTEAEHLACLRRVRAHLQPHGRFAFNVFHPSLEFMSQHAGSFAGVWRWASTTERADGVVIVRSDANRYDTVNRRIHSLLRYEEYASDGTLTRTSLHRLELSYLYPSDITRLLQEAGFRSIDIRGGFNERPFERDVDELVVQAGLD